MSGVRRRDNGKAAAKPSGMGGVSNPDDSTPAVKSGSTADFPADGFTMSLRVQAASQSLAEWLACLQAGAGLRGHFPILENVKARFHLPYTVKIGFIESQRFAGT